MKENDKKAEKEETEHAICEIEELTSQIDHVLLEVIDRRKEYPSTISDLLEKEMESKFLRARNSPLPENRLKDEIDVAAYKKDLNRKVGASRELKSEKKLATEKLEQAKNRLEEISRQNEVLYSALISSVYAPIHAIPSGFQLKRVRNN